MKMLDFNALQHPTFPVKLKDENQTIVHISTPTVELVDRLVAVASELQDIAQAKDARIIHALYGLIADLMNCNDDGLTFTGEELRGKYNLSLLDLFCFVSAYMDFVGEIQNAKN